MNRLLFFRRLRSLFSIPRDNPQLLIAQFGAFRRQMPLMYGVLIANTWALAVTHSSTAPTWLTLYVPGLFTTIGLMRIWRWIREGRRPPSEDAAHQALSNANWLAAGLSVLFAAWALLLVRYGNAFAQAHVAFCMAITVIGVMFSLMHLPRAAAIIAVTINGAFFGYFVMYGNSIFRAVSLNVGLVSGAMLVILANHYRDFIRMVEARAETDRLAHLDSLTGLPNRRSFFNELQVAYATAVAGKRMLAVGIVDLDGLKPVNDIHGHAMGDKLLSQVGERLAGFVAPHLRLARLGGDEFGLLISDLVCAEDLVALGERVCGALREPFTAGDFEVRISGSLGFAIYPTHCTTAAELYEFADYALYSGKRSRRGRAVIFSADHHFAIRRNTMVEHALLMADLDGELSVAFQPIVRVTTGQVLGFEALARWSNPLLGSVPPAEFIMVAERAGIVSSLTCILLRKALATALRWPHPIRLSFNLSAIDLASAETVSDILRLVAESGFDPSRLDFEITETAIAREFEAMMQAASRLRALGCGLSLDDFGVGYSSLSYLHALPLTKVKIDRSFVREMHTVRTSYKIVKSLLALGRDMGVETIVEGVETQGELEALKCAGGKLAQGFLFSRPVQPDETSIVLDLCLLPARPEENVRERAGNRGGFHSQNVKTRNERT
ncbi:Diguanylate cyclase/phosphodiesterase [Burkholderia sp. 8Y]|uniref:putative bifunctional diguanylate cyclase/phosphodiesterase n=1 Tax=Burkholderia sp. 8Y TaxID=2653133 RepID=UPI0012F299BE|nr:EAL domain-containing protein [Burkholderia sp. 8Y]VXC66169.1 Diguanylate cyclase/phosphodiesterase [Burkholderia sp. 8Y]